MVLDTTLIIWPFLSGYGESRDLVELVDFRERGRLQLTGSNVHENRGMEKQGWIFIVALRFIRLS